LKNEIFVLLRVHGVQKIGEYDQFDVWLPVWNVSQRTSTYITTSPAITYIFGKILCDKTDTFIITNRVTRKGRKLTMADIGRNKCSCEVHEQARRATPLGNYDTWAQAPR